MAPLRVLAQRTVPRALAMASQQVRGMATEKQILMQINATKNIQKITSSMKMVSAAKLKGDENRLAIARPFNAWTALVTPERVQVDLDTTYEELPQKCLLVPFTSDKGLCGGINSYISRSIKDCVKKLAQQGKDADIVVVGDKGRAQLRRFVSEKIARSATDVVSPGTFGLACAIASEVIAAGGKDYDAIVLFYNSYVNAAVYKQRYQVIKPFVIESEGVEEPLSGYEFDSEEKAEIMEDLYEYMLASHIFYSFMDGAASEQSSRMTAMENASKNASELIDSLTLRYNRARQARITTELIEIISGAAALDG